MIVPKEKYGPAMNEIMQLYYDKELNRFFDEDGYYVDHIYAFVKPYMLTLFFKAKDYMCFEVSSGCFVELIYPDEDADYPDYGYDMDPDIIDRLPFN